SSQCASRVCAADLDSLVCGVCLEEGDGITCGDGVGCTGINYCAGGECLSPVVDPTLPTTPPQYPGPGEECDYACEDGYVCAYSGEGDVNTCLPNRTENEPCYLDSPYAESNRLCSQLEATTYCDATGTCRQPA